MVISEDVVESWVCSPGSRSKAGHTLILLMNYDAFTKGVAEFYTDFYSELETIEGIRLPNAEIFAGLLCKGEGVSRQA